MTFVVGAVSQAMLAICGGIIMRTICMLIYLTCLSIFDLREKRVPVIWLVLGMLAAVGVSVYDVLQGDCQWIALLWAMMPGLFWMLMAWGSKKAGISDAVVLLILGLCLGTRECSVIFALSILLSALTAMILLVIRRVKRNSSLPYIPFLCAGLFIWRLCV